MSISRRSAGAWLSVAGVVALTGVALAARSTQGALPRHSAAYTALMPAPFAAPSAAGISRSSWTWLGPGNIGGRVRSIVVNPDLPSTWFAGSVSGGIWKTVNSGAHWEPVDDFLPNLVISTLVIQPGNPLVMYAGTGEVFTGLHGAGILKSTDGGTTWAQLTSTATDEAFTYVNRLAMSPDGTVLLAATWRGLYRSIDGGESFSLVLNTVHPDFAYPTTDVAFNPADNSRAIAAAIDGSAWYSTDGGVTWTTSSGLPVSTLGLRAELAYAPGNPAIVYASVAQGSGSIYKSTDGGVTYSFVSSGASYWETVNSEYVYDNTIWVDPTNADTLIVGGRALYRSTDGGVTLSALDENLDSDKHAIVSMPGYDGTTNRQVLVGSDAGVHFNNDISADPAVWESRNNNLGITQFHGAAGNAVSGTIVGDTQDNGTLRYTPADGPQGYTPMGGGYYSGHVASDPTDPNYFYSEGPSLSLYRSSDGGISWTGFFGSAIPEYADYRYSNRAFIAPFILDPNDPNTLLAGGKSLWRTTDAKFGDPPVFYSIKGPINGVAYEPGTQPVYPDNISAIAIAPGHSEICWVGHNNGDVYKATDCLATAPTWTQVDINAAGFPDRTVMRLTIDPLDPSGNRVYATFGGFITENVWRTDNGGASWSSVSGGGATALPPVPVHDLEIHPSASNWLYAATEIGVFTSQDTGATWQVPQDGPANVIVSELFWMGSDLVAATFGRGLYKATVVAPPSVRLVPTSLSFGNQLVGTPSPGQTVTLTNTGALPLHIAGLVPSPEFPIQSNTCAVGVGTSLPAGGSCTLSISFCPSANGIRTAKILIHDDAGDSPQAIYLTGTGIPADTTPPTVSNVTPPNGATGVNAATAVRATFSESINAATLTTSTFVLRNPADVVVAATVSYNAATRVGRLTPSAALVGSTMYTATITGGSSGVKDVAGNALECHKVWSFTTAPVTVGLTTIGSSLDTGDSNFLTGSKVMTSAAGQIASMSVYVGNIDSLAAKRKYQVAIYTDNAGRPGTLVKASATGTLVANSWNMVSVGASLQASRNYWLIYNTNGRTSSVNNMRYNPGSAGRGVYSNGTVAFGTWPTTFPAATVYHFVFSLFATFGP